MSTTVDYETDLYAWTRRQADALRRRAAGELVNETELDWENLAEEIESVGRSEKHEIRSRLVILLAHLLKWAYQSSERSNSWRASIRDARAEIEEILEDSPSLRPLPAEKLAKAYARARAKALDETGLLDLPAECPWTIDDVLAEDFLP